MPKLKTWAVGAIVTGVAVGTVMVAPAQADSVHDYDTIANMSKQFGETHVQWTHNTNNGHQQSIIRVTGSGTGEDRAKCRRRNGGTAWYQSTIQARGGATSHYDCNHNGTYNRGLVGQGVNLL